LSLFGRDEDGPSRARRARRWRARAQAARLPRRAIEELEPRVLLSGYGVEHPLHVVAFELPPTPAAVSSLATPLAIVQRESTALDGTTGLTTGSGAQWANLVNGSMPALTHSPLWVVVPHSLLADAASTGSGAVSNPAGSLDGAHPWPMKANDGNASSPSGVNNFSSSIEDAVKQAIDGSVTDSTAVFLVPAGSGSGWDALQTTVPGEYAPTAHSFDGPEVPVPPNSAFAEMRGTLDAGQSSMTYAIPIGPMTESLGVTVRPVADMPPGDVPVVDEMSLVDPSGKTLEQVGSPGSAGGFISAAVLVQLHGARAGDQILVQIGAAESSSSSPSSPSSTLSSSGSGVATASASSQSASWNVPFVLDVQRQQSSAASTDAGSVVSGTGTVGTLIVAPAQQPAVFASSSSSSAPAAQDGSTLVDAQATNTAVAAAAPAAASDGLVTESTDSFNVRVPTGPLASRGGGALGPTLALIDAEPTQPVDRLERALSQDIVGLGAGDGEQTASRGNGAGDQEFSDDPGTWPGSIGTGGTGGPVVSIPGRGGFPLRVTSPGRDQRGPFKFPALWATLPAAPSADTAVSNAAQSAISLNELPIVPAVAYRSAPETLECPDFVKAACGLALGLGLTTGPLFPDLIASFPGRLPKWVSILRAQSRRRTSARDSKRVSHRKMPNWLSALFASR
jgi:hypothetical protein